MRSMPHSGVGGWMPMPMSDSPATMSTMSLKCWKKKTNICGTTFGST